jgi:hypothetical protein
MKQKDRSNLLGVLLTFGLTLLANSPLVQAQSYNQTSDTAVDNSAEDTMDYDAIVNELSRAKPPAAATHAHMKSIDTAKSFSDSMIHLGIGYVEMMQNLATPNSTVTHVNQPGIQVSLGIDLFSPNVMAEGTMRNFGSEDYRESNIALKEFDLKFYYKNFISSKLLFKLGGGLSARYLTVEEHGGGSYDYNTPSSVGSLGLDMFFSPSVSVGAEFAVRAAMISDTIDKQSYDGLIRIDTHF